MMHSFYHLKLWSINNEREAAPPPARKPGKASKVATADFQSCREGEAELAKQAEQANEISLAALSLR
jgi:hypothetical protein